MLEHETVNLLVNGLKTGPALTASPFESAGTLERMAEWMGKETATNVAREVQGFEPFRALPDEHKHMLVLDSLTWAWDPAVRSYIARYRSLYRLGQRTIPSTESVQVKSTIAFSRGGNSLDMHSGDRRCLFLFQLEMVLCKPDPPLKPTTRMYKLWIPTIANSKPVWEKNPIPLFWHLKVG
jgi:hypothetical protein